MSTVIEKDDYKTVIDKENNKVDYRMLINYALDPANKGQLNKSYGMFYNYSPMNTILLTLQQLAKFGKVAPVASFNKWKELGYRVNKGAKSLWGWRPTGGYKMTVEDKDEDGNIKKSELFVANRFIFVPLAFSLYDTNCDKLEPVTVDDSNFDYVKLVNELKCKLVKFESARGNIGGYAQPNKKEIALNPLFDKGNDENIHTLIHELAHCMLHSDDQIKKLKLDKGLVECEAEMTAYIVMNTISNKYNTEHSIHYIKGWLKASKDGFPETSCKRVITLANRMIKIIKESKEG